MKDAVLLGQLVIAMFIIFTFFTDLWLITHCFPLNILHWLYFYILLNYEKVICFDEHF